MWSFFATAAIYLPINFPNSDRIQNENYLYYAIFNRKPTHNAFSRIASEVFL